MMIHQALIRGSHASRLSNEVARELVHKVRNLATVAVYALETASHQSPARARAKHELIERSILGMVDLVESTLAPVRAGGGRGC